MSDFRLEVFYTVAKRLSFTKAASELFITQPAVTKHIRELETKYQAKLFERNGNHVELTEAGQVLLKHAEKIFELYRNAEFGINALSQRQDGLIRLGASTTPTQYIIAPLLASFRSKFPQVQLSLITGNTEQVEKALLSKDIEIGIIEGYSKNTGISYHPFIKDEIVLVCGSRHPLAKRASLKPEELKNIPFVLREHGSGTLEVIDHALKMAGINLSDLPVEIRLGNSESIKSYLLNAPCMAFLSVHAVAEEVNRGELKIIDVEGLDIRRDFYLIHLQGKLTGLAELFYRFATRYHNLK
ncbi:MAG TPA: LysR family transcriptional regulator [Mucilaginibacter sp.]|nr:LysR family transcriptional regulator [Mucilaginibacter sp.]